MIVQVEESLRREADRQRARGSEDALSKAEFQVVPKATSDISSVVSQEGSVVSSMPSAEPSPVPDINTVEAKMAMPPPPPPPPPPVE